MRSLRLLDSRRLGTSITGRYDQDQMFTIDAADDGRNHASSIKMIDQPSWSIEEYLQLRDRIQGLPEQERDAAIAEFFESHPPGAGVRTRLSNENYPDAPSASRTVLHLSDESARERARLGVNAAGEPSLEFLDASGNVIQTYPPRP